MCVCSNGFYLVFLILPGLAEGLEHLSPERLLERLIVFVSSDFIHVILRVVVLSRGEKGEKEEEIT